MLWSTKQIISAVYSKCYQMIPIQQSSLEKSMGKNHPVKRVLLKIPNWLSNLRTSYKITRQNFWVVSLEFLSINGRQYSKWLQQPTKRLMSKSSRPHGQRMKMQFQMKRRKLQSSTTMAKELRPSSRMAKSHQWVDVRKLRKVIKIWSQNCMR